MELFESLHDGSNLFETNDIETESQFRSLTEMSAIPEPNGKYMVVPVCLLNNKIMVLDPPRTMMFIRKNNDQLEFSDGTKIQTYPHDVITTRATYYVFTFASKDTYSEFQTMMSLRFNTALPTFIQ
jgi:hypothetical protein